MQLCMLLKQVRKRSLKKRMTQLPADSIDQVIEHSIGVVGVVVKGLKALTVIRNNSVPLVQPLHEVMTIKNMITQGEFS